jgi:excisionase family DNA binding protein
VTEVLTLDEAAERMRVSRRTVERLIAEGRIRPVRIGRSVRVTDRELEAFLAGAARRRA